MERLDAVVLEYSKPPSTAVLPDKGQLARRRKAATLATGGAAVEAEVKVKVSYGYRVLLQYRPEIHITRHACRLLPGRSHTTMSVIETAGGLILYSPTPIDDELAAQISAFGDVTWIIAPNPFHHLSVQRAAAAFPTAQVYLARGLTKRFPEYASIANRSSALPELPGVEAISFPLRGDAEEVILAAYGLRTAFFADTLFNVHEAPGPISRLGFRVMRMYQRPTFSVVMKLMTGDRAEARRIFEQLADAGIETLLPCHGEAVTQDAVGVLRGIAASL